MADNVPVPTSVVDLVEQYVRSELSDAEQYTNRTPLDESGIWSLHRLAARAYASGFDAGTRIESERSRHSQSRALDALRKKMTPAEEQPGG